MKYLNFDIKLLENISIKLNNYQKSLGFETKKLGSILTLIKSPIKITTKTIIIITIRFLH